MGSNWQIKVADMGLAQFSHTLRGQKLLGSFLFMDPRVISGLVYTAKSAVYSAGIIAYELLTERTPYQEHFGSIQCEDDFFNLVLTGVRPTADLVGTDAASQALFGLITECWDENPDVRPPFAELADRLENMLTELQAGRLYDGESDVAGSVGDLL